VNNSPCRRIKIPQFSTLGKSSRILNHAENGGNVFDTRFTSQNLSISEIAKQTGFDRKTVRKNLQMETLSEP